MMRKCEEIRISRNVRSIWHIHAKELLPHPLEAAEYSKMDAH